MQKRGIFYTLPYLAFHNQSWKFIMKVTVFVCVGILVSAQLLLATPGFSQKYEKKIISLHYSNAPIRTIFRAIEKKADVVIMYLATDDIQKEKASISTDGKTVAAILDQLLKPEGISWAIRDNVIRLYRSKNNSPRSNADQSSSNSQKERINFQAMDVTGKVVDENGQPLAGATVKLKDGSQATTTDARGEFTLRQVQPDAMLVISFIGFQPTEVKASEAMGTIQMKVAESQLDQVQVIAYGKTSQRLSTGNVSTISAKDIEKQPVNNPLLALQGRVPGLFIQQATGLPGTGVRVNLQGQNSILNGNDPLYIIDGVPYSSQSLKNLGAILGPSNGQSGVIGNNPLGFINPADIESISVLKDADATSIYGSRAANGAILITTKKGKAGDTRVSFNLQNGWGKVTRKLDVLNAQQYLQMRHEALKNDNLAVSGTDYDLNGIWDTTRTTDWQKELIGNTAAYTDMQVSISGGNENTQYLIGSGYHRETTVFPGDFSDRKASVHFNLNNSSTNKKFKIGLSGSYMLDNNHLPTEDLTNWAVTLSPVAPALHNADGTLNWQVDGNGNSTWINPLRSSLTNYRNKTYNLVANGHLSYAVNSELTLSTNLGYTDLQSDEFTSYPAEYEPPQSRTTAIHPSYFGNNNINTWIAEPQLTYKKDFALGKIDFLLGSTFQQSNSSGTQLYGYGYTSDVLFGDISAASTIGANPVISKIYKYGALFSRFNYNYNDKYIVNLSLRRDGSSRFGPENKFHNFASIGGAWIFSEENFLKDKSSLFSFGKLRASFGTTGSDQVNDYRYINLYKSVRSDVSYLGSIGLEPSNLFNPYLQWEETRKLQVGLDLGFINNRILINTTYFRNRSSNQLISYTLPSSTGFNGIDYNLPATVQNSGLEMSVISEIIKSNNLNWNISFNLTIPKNQLIEFSGIDKTPYNSSYFVGEPITLTSRYKLIGVDPTNGQYIFDSQDGSQTYKPVGGKDQFLRYNTLPQFYGGIQNSLNFKSFELSFFLQFTKQRAQGLAYGFNLPGPFYGGLGNQPSTVLDRWKKPGDQASIQRYNSNFALNSGANSAINSAFSDASFIRLSNLNLSYRLPESAAKSLHLQYAKVFVQGQNLMTFTNYTGLDPETKSSRTLPPLRVLTLGIQLTL